MENEKKNQSISDELLTDVSGGAGGPKFLPCSDCGRTYPSTYLEPLDGKLLCKKCYGNKLLLGRSSDSDKPSTPTTSHDESGVWGGW